MGIYYNLERLKKWCVRNFNTAGRMSWKFRFQNFWYLHFGFLYPHNKKLRYRYVVSTAAYNVELYIEDYFRSIIWQSVNFKKFICLVITDDASTDNTAAIIKKWQRRYPKNIVYLKHTENQGVSITRNTGLKYALENIEADFITFTDPDDFVNRNYFWYVEQAITELAHNQEMAIGYVACRPIFFLEYSRRYNDHPLNFKFNTVRAESISVDSDKNMQFSVMSAFFLISSIRSLGIFFNESISTGIDDVLWVNEQLLQLTSKQRQILVPQAIVFYRKRKTKNSLMDSILLKNGYFIHDLQCWLELLKKRASLPQYEWTRFLDRVVLCYFRWYFRAGGNEANWAFHSQDVLDMSLSMIREIFFYVDAREIRNYHVNFYYLDKVRMLAVGHGEEMLDGNINIYCTQVDLRKSEIFLYTFVKEDVQFRWFLDGKEVVPLFLKKVPQYCWGQIWGYEMRIIIAYQKESQVLMAKMRGRWCHFYDYYTLRRQLLPIESIAYLRKMQTWTLYDKEKPDLWLLKDRDTQADDNAEHLYRYIRQNYPQRHIKFILSNRSSRWKCLCEEGFDLITYGSKKYRLCMKRASKLISSHGGVELHDWQQIENHFMDSVFLNHGVIKDNMSRELHGIMLSDGYGKTDLFITTTKEEFFSVADMQSPYRFFPFQVKMTGLARHDALQKSAKKDPQRFIIIMPTWRKVASTGNSWYRPMNNQRREIFQSSNYASSWKNFLGSLKLKDLLSQYGYSAIFFPHANSAPFLKYWGIPQHITCRTMDDGLGSIQEVFITSSLLITDFSSVAFDMAYIKRPVLYYQFDEEEYYSKHYPKGYFDYRRDGFGPVATTEENLLKELENLLKRDCHPEQQYLQRMESLFPFRDGQCCERIYQSICDLDKPRRPDDFDRDVLIRYAENAELRREINFAQECWLRLFAFGNECQKTLSLLHDNFCRFNKSLLIE
jgi:CDP-glycerol glycerophosphotransferase (TagB/SpsB family)